MLFVVPVATYPDGVDLGCPCRVANRRRVRRRWGRCVLTRSRVVRVWFDNGRAGQHESVWAGPVVVLTAVIDVGCSEWGVLTL